MNKRPLSITIISWFLIIMGVLSVFSAIASMDNPMVKELMDQTPVPKSIQYTFMFLGFLVTFVSGIGMLKGKNWARYLYVVFSVLGMIYNFLTSPIATMYLIPSAILLVVISFFLFRKNAKNYFLNIKDTSDV